MKNIKLILAYDGTDFLGWQKTPEGPTIEGTLEPVLEKLLQEQIILQAASRTDAGVHAEGQVVNFFTENSRFSLDTLQRSINALLPSAIRVLEIEELPPVFHPTLDNIGKEYHYYVSNTLYEKPKNRLFSWHVPKTLDLDLIRYNTAVLLGTHNFSAFSTEFPILDKDPTCTLYSIDIEEEGDLLCFKIVGNRFLFRMARCLIGTLVYIGLGRIEPYALGEILESGKRSNAGVTAPAHGLHLIEVFYKKEQEGILPINNQESLLC
jgi:tRNA pseudouridine38-40 synthase